MTYYGAKHLADAYRTVRRNTLAIAEEIPEEQYDFQPAPNTRSVRQLLTHIAYGHRFQQLVHKDEPRTWLEGIDFFGLLQKGAAEEQKPRTKPEILALLRAEGEAWAAWLEGLSDEFLAEPVSMLPGATPATKSRFEMLLSVKEHEMHHRGQLMLIQRLLGMVPPLTRERQARMAQAQAPAASA